MAENLLSPFFELLVEAYGSSEEFDDFDLDSSNPESVETYRGILRRERDACLRLAQYCQRHEEELNAQLSQIPEVT